MKLSNKIVIISIVYFISSFFLYAQDLEINDKITISFGTEKEGSPYVFDVDVPPLSEKWRFTISEFNGRVLFSDEGDVWPSTGYIWEPDADVNLYQGIYYGVAITFFTRNNRAISTKATKLYVPLTSDENRNPVLFFEGDTVDISEYLYHDSSPQEVLDFIVEQANNAFIDYKVLVRGHASYISDDPNDRPDEEESLLALSERRALAVVDTLAELGVEETRVFYESFGGDDEVSEDIEQRWKNRRVEIYFVQDVNDIAEMKEQEGDAQDEDATSTVVIVPNTGEVKPWPDMPIISDGKLPSQHILKFILYFTPTEDPLYVEYVERIIAYYIQESERESVNYDIAIAQMILETNFLRFTGQVRKEQYNFAGIGAINDKNVGNWFSTEVIGVRAHIQHLKGYAVTQPLKGDIVDPRYPILERLGLLGSSPLVSTLSGRWATDPNYSLKILTLLRRMYDYSNALTLANNEE